MPGRPWRGRPSTIQVKALRILQERHERRDRRDQCFRQCGAEPVWGRFRQTRYHFRRPYPPQKHLPCLVVRLPRVNQLGHRRSRAVLCRRVQHLPNRTRLEHLQIALGVLRRPRFGVHNLPKHHACVAGSRVLALARLVAQHGDAQGTPDPLKGVRNHRQLPQHALLPHLLAPEHPTHRLPRRDAHIRGKRCARHHPEVAHRCGDALRRVLRARPRDVERGEEAVSEVESDGAPARLHHLESAGQHVGEVLLENGEGEAGQVLQHLVQVRLQQRDAHLAERLGFVDERVAAERRLPHALGGVARHVQRRAEALRADRQLVGLGRLRAVGLFVVVFLGVVVLRQREARTRQVRLPRPQVRQDVSERHGQSRVHLLLALLQGLLRRLHVEDAEADCDVVRRVDRRLEHLLLLHDVAFEAAREVKAEHKAQDLQCERQGRPHGVQRARGPVAVAQRGNAAPLRIQLVQAELRGQLDVAQNQPQGRPDDDVPRSPGGNGVAQPRRQHNVQDHHHKRPAAHRGP
eukprot:Rhum_TRINITY_DN1691_c0_g1::Rhum_TRINITY_DN1691_c0_g1_i1::g.4553::m.4553